MEFIRWRNIFLMKNLLLQLMFTYIFLPSHTSYIIKVLLHLYMYIGCSMLFFVGAYIRADIEKCPNTMLIVVI